jgi:hypothetical protein
LGDGLTDWVKVATIAEELGVTHKTIYNWISKGYLEMVSPGFVSQADVILVWVEQRQRKIERQVHLVRYGIKRDASGRFISDPLSE